MLENIVLNQKSLIDDKKVFTIEIGKEIRRLRRRRGITGQELAAYLGVSQQQLSRYECGICAIKLDYLMVLLHYLEVSVDSFFKNVLVNVFEENNEIGFRYYNIFFPLDDDVKYQGLNNGVFS